MIGSGSYSAAGFFQTGNRFSVLILSLCGRHLIASMPLRELALVRACLHSGERGGGAGIDANVSSDSQMGMKWSSRDVVSIVAVPGNIYSNAVRNSPQAICGSEGSHTSGVHKNELT